MFDLITPGILTGRDEWVYDFDVRNLRDKALFFADTYNELMDSESESDAPAIKWSRDLRNQFQRGRRIVYNDGNRIQSLYRPFVIKHHFADFAINDVLTRNHYEMFGPDLQQPNQVINFCVNGKDFYTLATDRPCDVPLYRGHAMSAAVPLHGGWGAGEQHYRVGVAAH